MFSKVKGLSGIVLERRRRAGNGSKLTKKALSLRSEAPKDEKRRTRISGGVYGQGGSSGSSSNSESTCRSRIRTRRRKRRRMRARENREKKRGRRKRKPKKKVSTPKVIAGCSESSCSGSYHQLSSNTFALPHSSSVVEMNSSLLDCFDFPWGNLDMPMDLSQIELEVNDNHGVDFELLAQKNHERWLLNLEKARGTSE